MHKPVFATLHCSLSNGEPPSEYCCGKSIRLHSTEGERILTKAIPTEIKVIEMVEWFYEGFYKKIHGHINKVAIRLYETTHM